jgi:exodeoxyribonuclease V beta subunit
VLAPEGGFFQAPNAYPDPVRAGRPETRLTGPEGDLPPLRLLEVEASGGVGRLRSRIAAGIARSFRDLLDGGAMFHSGKQDEPPRPLHAGDFMVLTHTGAESKRVARALREAGLPSTFFKADGLFQTREALELRDLLRGILHPEDPDARGRALLTRFFGFSLAEAEACLDLPVGHPIRARLERWQDLAQQRRYARCFNALLEESGIVSRLLVTERGDRALTNLRHLLELLLAEAVAAHLDPGDLLRRLGRWIEARDLPAAGADPDLQRAEGEAQAVRILTIHKAKGLEAPVVALFGGYSEGQGAKASLQRFHDAADTRCAFLGSRTEAPAGLRGRIEQEAAREDERLLYVAMTRPQVQLVLPMFLPGERTRGKASFDAEGHPEGRHGALNRRLRAMRDAAPAAWKAWAAPLPEAAPAPLAASHPALPERLASLPLPPLPDFGALARRGRPLHLHSFTSLARAFGDGIRAASREEEGRADEVEAPRGPRPAEGLPGGTATGTALHALLERLPAGSTRRPSPDSWRETHRPLAEACLREQGLDPVWAEEALRLARLALTTPVALPAGPEVRLEELPRRLPEVGFQMPFPGHPDGLEGSLDLLFEAEGRLYVLDWKTNRLEGSDYGPGALARTVAAHYDLQVRIYTLAALAFAGIADEADYDARWGGAVYVFLRGLPTGGVWTQRPAWTDVQEWRKALAALPLEALALERLAWGMHG